MSGDNEKIVDCRGLACPQPVLLTKRALEQSPEALTAIVDNTVARENVAKFATASGYGVSIETVDGLYHLRMIPHTAPAPQAAAAEHRNAAPEGKGPVYLFTQEGLGSGSAELGSLLMKSFFASLLETNPQPRAILMLNAGVRLAVEDSPVLPALKTLEARGVSVQCCGVCLDYFGLNDRLAVGSITNMFSILAEMNAPGRTITL